MVAVPRLWTRCMRPTNISRFAAPWLALALGCAACGGDKKPASESNDSEKPAAAATCDTDDDCGQGLTCLGGECTDTSAKALYDRDSTNAVTPEKVQREVDKRSQQHVDRANEALNAE